MEKISSLHKMLIIGLLAMGYSYHLDAKVPSNRAEAKALIEGKAERDVWNRGNLLLSVGLDYKQREKDWYAILDDIGAYIKNVDSRLLGQFKELNHISRYLFVEMAELYRRFVVPMIIMPKKEQIGIMATSPNEIAMNLDFSASCPPSYKQVCIAPLIQQMKVVVKDLTIKGDKKSERIMRVRTALESILKEYRSQFFAWRSSSKQEAVEALILLADRINLHVTKFMTDYGVLMNSVREYGQPR
ncbi:MAG TPA: hypothetical protein VGT41_06260 [Candidatus Babeliales bacterium]|nr:hypothetical protein [Candidatus Babeliales bacterium]